MTSTTTNNGAPTSEQAEALLAVPGGKGALRREAGAFVSESGERFETEGHIVRTLKNVDPLLARELEAQAAAVDDYSDPRMLMPRYEHHMAELAVERLFGGAAPKGAAILDAGCGIGLLGRLYPDLGLVGLDASMPLLRKATTGYRLLVEGSAEALPFADKSFDIVIALNMLHHVIKPENAVSEFARVLKPGGTLVSVDPRKTAPIELAKRILRRNDQTFAETHKAFYTDEYDRLIEGSGAFRIEESKRVGLVSLVGMGGLDALKISQFIPTPQLAVKFFENVDDVLFRVPGVPRAGLNLAVKARRC